MWFVGFIFSNPQKFVSTKITLHTAPDDYAGASLRIVFTEEDDDICTQIPIVNDMFAESTERFFATLATQDLRISLLPATASISIVDDDSDDGKTAS